MLSKSLFICLLACLLAMGTGYARADDSPTTRDVRCVAVGVRIINLGDAQHRLVGTMLTMYYVGKIAGRTPDLDLESAIIREVGQMKTSDYAGEAQRCGAEMTAKGQQLQTIGKDMVARGKQAGSH